MKVLTCMEPGRFEYGTKEMPPSTNDHSILRIKRIGICGTDLHAFEGTQPFFTYPRILGHELAGELVEINNAPGFQLGEAVTFIPYFNCGHCKACRMGKPNCCTRLQVCGVHVNGGMAEYLSVPSACLVHGDGLSFDELALVEPLAIGAHGISRANISAGEFVLVIGAGPIGLAAMEFARLAGAHVIALDINERRLQFCKDKLHIAYTINATTADVTEQLKTITNGDMPTTVIDATGNRNAINQAFGYMAHGGKYVLIGLQKDNISFSHPEFHKREGTLMSSRNATRKDFEYVIACMKQRQITPGTYITHHVMFEDVIHEFENWLDPSHGVIKAMVEIS